jgi:hypothetical protein
VYCGRGHDGPDATCSREAFVDASSSCNRPAGYGLMDTGVEFEMVQRVNGLRLPRWQHLSFGRANSLPGLVPCSLRFPPQVHVSVVVHKSDLTLGCRPVDVTIPVNHKISTCAALPGTIKGQHLS